MKLSPGKILVSLFSVMLLSSCGSSEESTEETERVKKGTPVTVGAVEKGELSETIELNAISSFLLKSQVKSPANGFLQNVKVRQGDFVRRDEVLMSVTTKEAQSLGSEINKLDTSFHFKGRLSITAPANGYISQLNFQDGDYVQDGEQLALISDAKSFAFVLELPYELKPILKLNNKVRIRLPDATVLNGNVEKAMPVVDPASQTQNYLISVNTEQMIPENLIAKVILVKSARPDAISVPKPALLSDVTQKNFWVMKLVNDSMAVKVPVQKGIETNDRVEIISPQFSVTDKILVTGNYGLGDTALVVIKK
jgi:multidrug efflux pump subunit AcrA (membrane-fusion protein)